MYHDGGVAVGVGDDSSTVYDPERMDRVVNISDPDELEAHLEIQDIRMRLRQRRRRAIRCFTIAFVLVVAALLAGIGYHGVFNKSMAAANHAAPPTTNTSTTPTTTISTATTTTTSTSGSNANTNLPQTIPNPPIDLASRCSTASVRTSQGLSLCKGECEVAECCTIPEGFALSCPKGNEVVCAQYIKYCTILDHLPNTAPEFVLQTPAPATPISTPSPTTNNQAQPSSILSSPVLALTPTLPPALAAKQQEVKNACNPSTVETIPSSNTNSTSPCQKLCQLAQCCFSHFCQPPDTVDCTVYAACYVVYQDDGIDDDHFQNFGSGFGGQGSSDNPNATASNLALMNNIHNACYTGDITSVISNNTTSSRSIVVIRSGGCSSIGLRI